MIRQPIVAIMGHVDHGKTFLLDKIRGTAIAAREAGGITQAIGASIIPLATIKSVCGALLEQLKFKLTIPGLLFIDTPGHAAFVNLRKRGGNLADIAILVVDINEGVMPQTKESIEILKQYKTPFIIAANKIDLIQGWSPKPGTLLQNISSQTEDTQRKFETKLYELVGQIYELGIEADRYDRVSDYTKTAAVVPVSAKTGAGVPELLMMLTGLAQRFLEQGLQVDVSGPAKGTILEVKEQKGLGTVLDTIVYDGTLNVGDSVLVGTLDEPVQAKVKALFQPSALAEMREKKTKFVGVKSVSAASGVRVVVPGAETAVAGAPIMSAVGDVEKVKKELQEEMHEVLIEADKDGIIVKADSLGSLEALMTLLKQSGIPIRKSGIGPITKKDISDAEATLDSDPLHSVILGFNIPKPELETSAHVIVHDIIYRLIEDYSAWKASQEKKIELSKLDVLVSPCRVELLKGYVFRQSNPAIVGVEVMAGVLKPNTPLMKADGRRLTEVKGIQVEQENVERLDKGKQGAASMPGVIVGRQINEGDILFSAVPEEDFRQFKEYKEHLTADQKSVLKEIAEIMRKENPVWGI
ncbi:translation initiation factor IF-2 [Candidatus Woesearchaeota archaeon]|nr:translation initiation factor IF-2 [Candidatus Woesearchaeota archaeon]